MDLPKTYAVLLRNLYKTLFNIQMRKRAEEEDNALIRGILDKCERGGMRDESQLTRPEREMLADWQRDPVNCPDPFVETEEGLYRS